jgi:hypothetical protein
VKPLGLTWVMPFGDRLILGNYQWSRLLKSMDNADFQRTYFHPEKQRSQTLAEVTLMYTWHSKHHLAYILLPEFTKAVPKIS